MTDPVKYIGNVADVRQEGPRFAVYVRQAGSTYSVWVGSQPTLEKAIQTAKRLDRSPANAQRFAGFNA